MRTKRSLLIGAAGVLVGRAIFQRALLMRLRGDVARLNAGDYGPLLAAFADDAVLQFNDGPHRWAGEHRGHAAIESFLQSFVAAGLQGEIIDFWTVGPPWAMTLICRFDDWADDPEGRRIYENRTALIARTRWGKIVEQRDFYEDTGRIVELDRALVEVEARSGEGVPSS